MRKEEAVLLYTILKGVQNKCGKIIEKSILSYYCDNYKGLIPYPTTIYIYIYIFIYYFYFYFFCILGRVEGIWEEEERCPKTSPLTFTGITKPPSNKGKEK